MYHDQVRWRLSRSLGAYHALEQTKRRIGFDYMGIENVRSFGKACARRLKHYVKVGGEKLLLATAKSSSKLSITDIHLSDGFCRGVGVNVASVEMFRALQKPHVLVILMMIVSLNYDVYLSKSVNCNYLRNFSRFFASTRSLRELKLTFSGSPDQDEHVGQMLEGCSRLGNHEIPS